MRPHDPHFVIHSKPIADMIPRIVAIAIVFLSVADSFAEDSFFVFAPRQDTQQVMCLSVRTADKGILIDRGSPLPLPFGPTGITVNANRNHLIATAAGKQESSVATLEILQDGQLRLIESSKIDHPPGYTSVDRSGRYLLSANYRSGTIAVYRIKDNGGIGDEACSLKTPNAEAHCILTTRDNRFAYIPCVKNNNALYQYAFDTDSGQLRPLEPLDATPPAMFGPRHVAYQPTLPMAYFSNEQQLGVSVYRIGPDGQLSDEQHAVTMPRRSPFEQGKRDLHASDLVMTPDGTRLFVAVRDFEGNEDSVFTFQVLDDGKLSQIARTKVGDIPWKLDLSPDGKLLLVSESADHRLSVFKIQPDGKLSQAAQLDWETAVRDMVVAQP